MPPITGAPALPLDAAAVTPGEVPGDTSRCSSEHVPGRLKVRADFLRVAARGRKTPMPGMVLQVLKRGDDGPVRLGFTVTKKVGNAVIRNRTRRRMREAARLLLREMPVTGADLVLVGRDGTRGRAFTLLMDDLRQALAKAGVSAAGPGRAPLCGNPTQLGQGA